jgi:hypothetical protein
MPLTPVVDYVPIAMKVPDCVQSPVEMFFAVVKARFRKRLNEYRISHVADGHPCSARQIAQLAFSSFEEVGTPELVKKCWEHARKSLLVWTTPVGQWVQIDGLNVQGSGGNWVHNTFRG